MSMHRTRWPLSANATARFRVVVVLATPPFWLAKAMTFIGMLSPSSRKAPSWSVRDPSRAVFAPRLPIPPDREAEEDAVGGGPRSDADVDGLAPRAAGRAAARRRTGAGVG